MKYTLAIALVAILSLTPASALKSKTMDRTVTQVVKLLQGMLEKSKQQADEERTAYAKYICDCDKRSTEYKDTISDSDTDIAQLSSQISELKADTGVLSTECAKLTADMALNEQARQEAKDLRNKQNSEFTAEKQDLEAAIGQLNLAVSTLASVNADQTSEGAVAKDNTKFMSGYEAKFNPVSLLKAKSSLQSALDAASRFLDGNKRHTVASFMQAPFTGSYTSQAVEVMGILKNMRDTLKSNLEQAEDTEAAQLKAFQDYTSDKEDEYNDMDASYDKKQGQLSSNDESLSLKKQQKKDTEDTMAEAEEFLETTETMCADKKAEYSKRRLLQTQEEAAISEAISILDSDEAFATFGTVTATSTSFESRGGQGLTRGKTRGKTRATIDPMYTSVRFLQLKSVHKHVSQDERRLRSRLLQTLTGSSRLSRIASLVQATNVFKVVLDEIENMVTLIQEEAKEDKDNLDFCNSERAENDEVVSDKTKKINEELEPSILSLTADIENPEDGIKKQIANNEAVLLSNQKTQKDTEDERAEENLLYQKDMKNIADAKTTLESAISVLDMYYKKLDKALELSLVQKRAVSLKNTPVPTTDTAVLKMQGESTSGKDVIDQLKLILSDTEAEELQATNDEKKSQEEFDRKMNSLKGLESGLQGELVRLEDSLASAEKDLLSLKEDLKSTKGEKAAAEAYLASIKPGCDFITANFELRETNRGKETTALNNAVDLIKGTPTYQNFQAKAHLESLGSCVEECAPGEEKAECKACLADVTVVAYCAGHVDTPGCSTRS
mmetsp:Transcript_108435/g.203523  ORF Transcript_108435/g.203523 Transcript_108435/m.203523 type:complete len:785 (-) Transcript_108435:2-2356(-)